MLPLLILFALAAHHTAGGLRHVVKCDDRRCRCWLPHRFLAGRPMNGKTVTNATFWRDATKPPFTQTGHAPKFHHLARVKLVGVRYAAVVVPALVLYGCLVARTLTVAALAAAVAAGVAYGAVRAVRAVCGLRARVRHRSHRKQPMSQALGEQVSASPKTVAAALSWNEDYANAAPGDSVAVLDLSAFPAFKASPKDRAAVEHLFTSRIGFELVFQWRVADERPVLEMTRAHELPQIVYLHEVLDRVEALPEDKTAVGLDDQGGLVCWDWNSESPHGLLNAGSRHGKTETEEGMVAQVLRKGGTVTYIDVKRVSIQGLKGLPDLTLCDNPRDMPGIWKTIEKWGRELDRRIDARTKDPTAEFPRNLLVLEEVNQFSEMCDEFWETWPEEDEDYRGTVLWKPRRAKRTPPIWRVVKKGVWEGAFAKQNVLIAGQNIEAQTVRGVRNSIGMRLLGGYQPQNWKALVGTTPVPAAPPQKGRWCMVNGSSQTWVQALIADLDANKSAAIWRDYARNGRRLDGTEPATEPVTVGGYTGGNGRSGAQTAGTLSPVTEMGLLDIVRAFLLPGGSREDQQKLADVLRQDRWRSDHEQLPGGLRFPEPQRTVGQKELFDPAQVVEFNAARRG